MATTRTSRFVRPYTASATLSGPVEEQGERRERRACRAWRRLSWNARSLAEGDNIVAATAAILVTTPASPPPRASASLQGRRAGGSDSKNGTSGAGRIRAPVDAGIGRFRFGSASMTCRMFSLPASTETTPDRWRETSLESAEFNVTVRPGRLGPYEILSPLGAGGMGRCGGARPATGARGHDPGPSGRSPQTPSAWAIQKKGFGLVPSTSYDLRGTEESVRSSRWSCRGQDAAGLVADGALPLHVSGGADRRAHAHGRDRIGI
jgi:hypothetical protein